MNEKYVRPGDGLVVGLGLTLGNRQSPDAVGKSLQSFEFGIDAQTREGDLDMLNVGESRAGWDASLKLVHQGLEALHLRFRCILSLQCFAFLIGAVRSLIAFNLNCSPGHSWFPLLA